MTRVARAKEVSVYLFLKTEFRLLSIADYFLCLSGIFHQNYLHLSAIMSNECSIRMPINLLTKINIAGFAVFAHSILFALAKLRQINRLRCSKIERSV